ncbi:isoquinoline 1-oxidoreductase subunit alpha (plasmid) [Cupriavidus necator N-1]|uniref:Isoquinoline 1-oxidoreductase subunit alpha n=1 Tax=Cupriavidus necator (strain ATCC 43291 / DSM 13513 / CCUG 52238 / LMG 8453 / N-1) TaxID=1042878 RepID=F8GX77_CUPNN|nr:(2Fe-2S)-binding protein [Cupriavidus necator]AEI81947.1 isoquinoline 1-oxidoreductase subunit alpha [Cupriavidus necator N-1]MDX6008268.1 (2Fe-2S)-binding protein [Cupriavidus necator]
MLRLDVNGTAHTIDCEASTPLLWVLRDHLNLTGTKFGCGAGQCGACTVHLDGAAVRSCVLPAIAATGRQVQTIEGLASGNPHPLQDAWIELQVSQCGYCQSGMLMAAAALLAINPTPNDADIDAAITNLCRCGTYGRVREAIRRVGACSAKCAKELPV